jgi:hypothetical protein
MCQETEELYIRYVGKTTYSPWHRFHHDLSSRAGSFSIRFMQLTLLLYPHIIQATKIYKVSSTEVYEKMSSDDEDAAEQELIALLQVSANRPSLFITDIF